MSILIKGMNIPENCLMCPFHGFGDYKGESIVCALTGRSEGQLSNVLGCPLVEVPTPHGRLIDADALHKATYHRAFETDGDTKWQSGCWVRYRAIEQVQDSQPTIIEAEEGEEE